MKKTLPLILLCLSYIALGPAPLYSQPALLGLRSAEQQPALQTPSLNVPPVRPANASLMDPPAMLVLPAGTIITVEASEWLSSNKQKDGDDFVAELQQPLVVDGWVVARPGQTVMGRVSQVKKAGRVKGTAKLSLELRHIVLVDGTQAPVQSDLMENSGPTSHGRDLAAVGITTGIGAALGAVCGAKGAAIGAAAGATASIAGVLLTRGEKVEVSPEKLLTFRLASPLTVSTGESRQAFWKVTSEDYVMPDKLPAPGAPAPVLVSQPVPRHVPWTVWPESQGIAVGRPGHRGC